MSDMISRQSAIDATAIKIKKWDVINEEGCHIGLGLKFTDVIDMLTKLPSVHPDGIPLEWINKHLEWLDNCDNDFAQLAKVGIRAMVELWKKDRI